MTHGSKFHRGPACSTVTGTSTPSSLKIWVIPTFVPKIAFFILLPPVFLQRNAFCVHPKTEENDGYNAVQVGFVDKKDRIVTKDANGKKEIYHRHGATKAEKSFPVNASLPLLIL